MAQVLPAKRPRGLTDHHRVSLNGTAGPSRNKRPRPSPAEPSERGSSEDLESTHAEEDDASSNAPDKEDDEAAYIRATQIVEKSLRKTTLDRNTPAEAGIIEEIRCTNFMCHEQLTVPLGPLINFIIGHNGSGKSAVLTALTLCLGGKATATNRGQNLKSFIKEGREYSVLSVKIKNQGSTAYKPEQYGDSIFVERHFNRAGTSGFKLKDRNGKIVSTKKADLEDIIDAFAMQIDNPMNVLTQDMARQFLNDSNPKEKYKFFLKGTQLETLSRDYAQIAQELEEQESRAQTLQGDLEVYKKKFEEAVRRAKRARNLEKMRAEEASLAHQAAWAHVEGEEQELAQIDTELERIAGIIESRTTDADAESEQYSRADQALNNAKEELQELQAELQPAEDEVAESKAKWDETKKQVFGFKATEREIAGAIKTSEKSIANTQSQIQDHRDRQAQADNGLHAQRLREYGTAKAVYEERKEAWENHDRGLVNLNEQLNAAREQKKQTDVNLQQKRNEETQSRTKIRNLEQGQRKWIDAYQNPANLEKLIRAIEGEKRFRERPVGPMGRYVELKRPEWGPILEKSFGSALNAFVVTSKGDQSLLSDIMRRFNWQAPILIGKKERINTTGNEPDEALLTWMRVLEISNDLVRNQLIINQSIDQVVLIPKREDAWNFMNQESSKRNHVKMCFCMSDRSRKLGHVININQSGGPNLGYIDEYRGLPRMQADKGPQIHYERETLVGVQEEIRNIEVDARAAQEHLNACQAKLQDHKKGKKDLKLAMDRSQDDMDRLEDEVNAATPDAAMIEQLENELTEAQGQLTWHEGQYQDLVEQLDKANAAARADKDKLDEADKTVQEIRHRLDKANTKVQTLTQRREQALRRKNAALEEVQEAQTNKTEWEQKREEQQRHLDSVEHDARVICSRVEVPANEDYDSLKRKLDRKIVERERCQNELGGSEQELLNKANAAKKTYSDARKEVDSTESVRRERWLRFRQEISVRARVTFNYLLSERQFRGSLSVDHKNQRLDIHVQPDITVNSAAGRQTKTLSGGEKSFSTICLLLALWDAMGSPIRCLDEFDVFMDSVNREISMTMMIGAARRAVGRQYILITPQAMNNKNIHSMDDVKIIRMDDPERGQTALSFRR